MDCKNAYRGGAVQRWVNVNICGADRVEEEQVASAALRMRARDPRDHPCAPCLASGGKTPRASALEGRQKNATAHTAGKCRPGCRVHITLRHPWPAGLPSAAPTQARARRVRGRAASSRRCMSTRSMQRWTAATTSQSVLLGHAAVRSERSIHMGSRREESSFKEDEVRSARCRGNREA